jgi:hypothetical protein
MGFGASPKNGRPHVTERFTAFQDASSNPDIPATCRASHDVAIQAENTLDSGHHDAQFDGKNT